MARLILLNGAPGTGKSTLAARFVADRPLALALDIDTVRGMLGGWLDTPAEAGLAARDLALAMADTHLRAGLDVVVPQFLGRIDFVLRLEELAAQVDARFVEVALICTVEQAVDRFTRRSSAPATAEQRDAAALQERSGGVDELRRMHRRLQTVLAARPATRTVPSVDGEIERTYRLFNAAVEDHRADVRP